MSQPASSLPLNLYTAAGVRELDRLAIEDRGIAGIDLMERAGQASFKLLQELWPSARMITVLCGNGNNGGDGYVIARLASEAGLKVRIIHVGARDAQKGDALSVATRAKDQGLPGEEFQTCLLEEADVVVDALLGTGLDRELDKDWRELILAINSSAANILSIDIPSGLHADTGSCMSVAIRAGATISFIGLKQGLFTGRGPEHCGELHFSDLAVPADLFEEVSATAMRIDNQLISTQLRPRPRDSHKGDCGHVLVIGGDYGFAGAVRLAGEAALRSGAGLVTIASRPEHCLNIPMTRPELMTRALQSPADLEAILGQVDVVVIGPGLGQSTWAQGLLARVLECKLAMVMDADALNLLAGEPAKLDEVIITPHPGEAARLLSCSVEAINKDRFTAITELQSRYGGVSVLKGSGTLVYDGSGPVEICTAGNPGMASGGMGDVLGGVIAAMLAQGFTLANAARLGVCLHSEAADRAAIDGERGLLAGDLMKELRRLANPE